MACHAEIPGYYFDPVRNKYFKLLKRHHGGEIPVKGISSEVDDSSNPAKQQKQVPDLSANRTGSGVLGLLRSRETLGGSNFSFQRQWMEALSSKPQICDYGNLGPGVIADMEQLSVDLSPSEGFPQMNVLLTGNKMGTIKLWEVVPSSSAVRSENTQKIRSRNTLPRRYQQHKISGCQSMKAEQWEAPFLLSLPASLELATTITAIRRLQGCDNYNFAVVAGLGSSGICGENGNAGLFLLSLSQRNDGLIRNTLLSRYKPHLEIWTAESDPEGRTVSIGLQNGAALISLEGGAMQTIGRGNTVLAQEFDKTGNIITCGFRKGVIYDIDKRAAPVKLKYVNTCSAMNMHSPICSIRGLQSNEYHLLASSMDGQIKRWDRRSTRIPILSYEGNVNSSTKVQLGVDHAEALIFCGGEDQAVRIWSLTSGRLLYTGVNLPGPITSVRRPLFTGWDTGAPDHVNFVADHSWGIWMGAQSSPQSLFYMHSSPI